jgi:hypothetical protein
MPFLQFICATNFARAIQNFTLFAINTTTKENVHKQPSFASHFQNDA